MRDYEMFDGDIKTGTINIYWDNINKDCKDSIIRSDDGNKYRAVSIDDNIQKYEIEFVIDDVDDIFDIVSKYISDDSLKFKEIDKIKNYNNIKNVKKDQSIKLLIPSSYLKYFNKSLKDVDKNSIINSKIYFIKNVCDSNKMDDIRSELNNIISYFNSIINSNEYACYEVSEK